MRTAPFFLIPILACVALLVFKKPTAKSSPLFRIQEKNKIGFIDKDGQTVIPPQYFNGSDFSEGLAAVRQNGLYGYIDQKGKVIITLQFDWADPFSDGLAVVNKDGHSFYIDHNGKTAFPCNYNTLEAFDHSVAQVQTAFGNWGLIDKHGRLILDTAYASIQKFDHGVAVVELRIKGYDSKNAVIDTLGHFIIPLGMYKYIENYNHGYCLAEDCSNNQLVLDRSGTIVFQRYRAYTTSISYEGFSDGIAPIHLRRSDTGRSHMGYIDIHNRLLLDDTTVREAKSFSCGRAFISHSRSYYNVIDTHMHLVGKEEFQFIKDPGFVNGYALVSDDSGSAIIDTNAQIVYRPSKAQFHQFDFLDDRHVVDQYYKGGTTVFAIRKFDGKMLGLSYLDDFDRSGFVNGLLKVIIAGKLAVMDTLGKTVWQDTTRSDPRLIPLNTDYMMAGYFYAFSSPDKNGIEPPSGGWATSPNIPKKIRNKNFGSGNLRLIIDTTSTDTFSVTFRGYPVYLANTTGDTCWFNAEDSRLDLITQAQGRDGEWKDIDYLPSSWCGNSYHQIALEPGAYWKFVMPQFEGDIPVNLRLQLEIADKEHPRRPVKTLFSNTIRASINPAQYWNKRPYYPQNIMDPYYD